MNFSRQLGIGPCNFHPLGLPSCVNSTEPCLFLSIRTDCWCACICGVRSVGFPAGRPWSTATEMRSGSRFRPGGPWCRCPSDLWAPRVHSLSSPWARLGMSSLFPALTRRAGPPVSPGWLCSEAGHCQVQLFDLMFQGQVLSGKLSLSQPSSLRKIDVQLTGFASC